MKLKFANRSVRTHMPAALAGVLPNGGPLDEDQL